MSLQTPYDLEMAETRPTLIDMRSFMETLYTAPDSLTAGRMQGAGSSTLVDFTNGFGGLWWHKNIV